MPQLYEILGISRKRLSHFYKTINSFPPEPPKDFPLEDESEAKRDRKCQLCGDYFTEAELEVHHCN